MMAVTAEFESNASGRARRAKGRPRQATWVFGVLAVLCFAVVAASYLQYFSGWPAEVRAGRQAAMIFGIGLTVATAVLGIGDTAYHAIGKVGRWISGGSWWVFIVLAYGFSTLNFLILTLVPDADWVPELTSLVVTIVIATLMSAMFSSQLTAPLLATTRKPGLYQSRYVQTMWMVVLAMLVVAISVRAVISLRTVDDHGLPGFELAALIVTISVGVLGAILNWHRTALDRLAEHRARALAALGGVLDAFDLDGDQPASKVKAVRELRRILTPSPYASQSFASHPRTASFEVVEIIKLIEWAFGPTTDLEIPESVTRRAVPGRPHHEMFANVERSDREGVKLRSRDFMARCYQRLLINTDPVSAKAVTKSGHGARRGGL